MKHEDIKKIKRITIFFPRESIKFEEHNIVMADKIRYVIAEPIHDVMNRLNDVTRKDIHIDIAPDYIT